MPDIDLLHDRARMPRRAEPLYDDPGPDFYTRLHPDRAKNRALDQLRTMGYNVTLSPLEAAGAHHKGQAIGPNCARLASTAG